MHRNRTWLLDPIELRTQRNRILPIEGGDGSTLSLDFTTGVLDPRLTFTRGSNATFINSSGLVQYANHNLWYNTAFAGISGTNPTLTNVGWSYAFSAANSSATFNGDGTVTISATASRRALQRITGFSGSGRRMIVSVDILTSGDTGLVPTQLLRDGSLLNSAYFIDGSPYVSGNVFGPCTLSYVCDAPTPGTFTPYFGVGTSGNSTGTVTFTNPRMGLFGGVAPLPYYANTSSGASPSERHDARFDHDPTTLAPRGLLVEGVANNLVANSSAMWNWGTSGPTKVQDTAIADIFGLTGTSNITTKVVKASGAGSQFTTLSFAIPQITVPANTSVDVTLSVWIRMDGANQPKCSLGILDTSGTPSFGATFGTQSPGGQSVSNSSVTMSSYSSADCDYTFGSVTGWVRCSVSRRLNNTTASPINWTTGLVLIYPDRFTTNAATIYVCGGQVELGIGPSSWIPTGASTGQRLADSCVMTGTNFSSWFAGATEGVLYSEFEKPRSQSGTIGHDHNAVGSRYASGNGFSVYAGFNNNYPTTLLWSTGGAIFPGGIASAIPSVTKQAGKWFGGNDATNFANGVQGTTGAGTGTLTLTMLSIGANSATGTEATRDWLNACVRRVKFWPTALPDSQIIALTT